MNQNEYHFKNLTNWSSLQVPHVRCSETHPQANTDFSLQFCTSSPNKDREEVTSGSKDPLSNLTFRQIFLSESLEDASQNNKKTQLSRRNLAGFNNETQRKPKTVPLCEQDVSNCSVVIDSSYGKSTTSKDMVRVISGKRFWKMRECMINQQKIFAAQVFELHRLIKIQKMLAKSPNLILESKLNGAKLGTVRSKVKEQNTESNKFVTEEYPMLVKPDLPLVLPSVSKELIPSLGNQWLVPVMSASEGLVYKPGPPPSSAFMVPIYSQDPLEEAAFRFPVSSQSSHIYLPPTNTKTTMDRTNPFGQLTKWSSTSSHVTQVIPFSLKKSQEYNESEVHGSTASSPPEKHKFELLPLFPIKPTHQNL